MFSFDQVEIICLNKSQTVYIVFYPSILFIKLSSYKAKKHKVLYMFEML